MNGKKWTQEEIDILITMYPDHFASEVAAVLGRDVRSIYNKAINLGDQMAKENSFYAKYPKELQDVIRLKGVVNRQIHKIEKRNGK